MLANVFHVINEVDDAIVEVAAKLADLLRRFCDSFLPPTVLDRAQQRDEGHGRGQYDALLQRVIDQGEVPGGGRGQE